MIKALLFALLLMVVVVSTEDDREALLKKFQQEVNRAPFMKPKVAQRRQEDTNSAGTDSDSTGCPQNDICDPLFPDQWHLNKEFLDLPDPEDGIDMGVKGAWEQGFYGKGVLINFVDDGVQIDHPDLEGCTRSVSYDFEDGGSDPSKDADHGTSCAGVAVARRNSVCGVGVAFEADYGGVRLIGAGLTAADEATALTYGLDEVDIYSNSWGPIDDGLTVAPLSPVVSDALEQGVNEGRGGKGAVYMWAGGNGGGSGDSCAYDGYVASQFTIAVGAVDERGERSYYSESCASLLGVTTSSGDTLGITTTDRTAPNGYNRDGECTNEFSGTSAATPMGSGVVALMLEANPDLTWRDVQGVLIHSAVKTDSEDPDWKSNGAGLLYNPNYGYGLLNATRAVNMALVWEPLKPYSLWDSGKKDLESEELPAGPDVFEYKFEIEGSNSSKVEHVILTADIHHPARNNLTLTITSPAGTVSTLASPHLQGQIPTYFLVLSKDNEYEFPGAGMGFGTVHDQEASGNLIFVFSCQPDSGALANAVVMVQMDQESCTPFEQFIAVQNAGAKAVVFVPDYEGEFQEFEGTDDEVVIPVMQIARSIGSLIMDPEYGFENHATSRVAGIEHLQADYDDYPFSSFQFWGESGIGTWSVKIEDDEEAGGTQGTIESLKLTVYGEGFSTPYEYEHKSGFSPVKIFLIVAAILLVLAVAILVGLYYVKRPAPVSAEPEQHDGFGRLESAFEGDDME